MKNHFWKKALAGLMALLIVAGGVPVQPVSKTFEGIAITANADELWTKSADNTTLGTSGIAAPKAPTADTDAWTGNYVYYGKYNNISVKYRVLAPNTDIYGSDTMLLDCDSILEKVRFDNDGTANTGAAKAYEWAYSDLKNWLNSNAASIEVEDGVNKAGFLAEGNFTTSEYAAIANSTIASHELVKATPHN